ncbi:4Fe-4S dicluster domain-containing protein [Acidobacteriota bacterium]
MNFWIFIGEIAFLAILVFFFYFTLFSAREKEERAFRKSLLFFLLLLTINFAFFFLPGSLRSLLFLASFILGLVAVFLIYFSQEPRGETKISGEQKKIDERDTIFSRFEYGEKTQIRRDYYERKPELKTRDDEIRKLPDLLSPDHVKKDPVLYTLIAAESALLKPYLSQVTGKENPNKIELSPFDNTRHIRNILNYFGADTCGMCEVDQNYVYSHVGRGPEPYGAEINLLHKYAIVFALPMELSMIAASPKPPVYVETERKYLEVGKIALIVSDVIRRMGYKARAHIAGSNYQAILPPLGWKAGLGEIGRIGILITKKYGPRVRLGLITTDIPLSVNSPRIFGVQDFCQKCQKCATNCPAQAIPHGDKIEENGGIKWVINREGCYQFWRKAGTDCAMCIYVCPFSKPNNTFHNFVRNTIFRSSTAQRVAIWADDYFYGKNPLPKEPPF